MEINLKQVYFPIRRKVMQELLVLKKQIIACEKCPRLRRYCQKVAEIKKREFRDWTYWGKPVPGFGDPSARFWIVGLAPAAHGANRTGRMFTGDSSGNWLYRALYQIGLSNKAASLSSDDGLKLRDVFISAAVRCAPPDNKPLPEELNRCATYLDAEFEALKNVRVILATGAIAFRAVCQMLERKNIPLGRPKPKFKHGAYYDFGSKAVLCSYHPSRQNTQTGRLTEKMWQEIFTRLGGAHLLSS